MSFAHRSHVLTYISQRSKQSHTSHAEQATAQIPRLVADGKDPIMLISIALKKLRRWLLYRATVRELERLADKDLSDLGIGRSDIKDVARQTAK